MKKIIKTLINEKWLHIIIAGIIINALCFLMSFLSSAAVSPYNLPYIVTNENTSDFSSFDAIFSNKMGFSMLNAPDGSFGYDYYEGGRHYYSFYIPTSNSSYSFALSNDNYETFDITQNRCEMTCSGTWRRLYWHNAYGGTGFYGGDGNMSDFKINFFQGTNKGDGSVLVPNISTVNFNYDDDIYKCVFGFGNPTKPIVPTGHATPPGEYDNPTSTTDHDLPREVPHYPIVNNYSWTTYNNPTVDTTNLESLIESLIDIVLYNFNYLFSNLSGLFNNLLSNIKGFFEYLGSVIEYYGGLIISNIQNAITTFYNNMVSLVESISGAITSIYEFLTNPLDTAQLNSQLNNSSFVSAIRTTETQISSFFGIFSNISQPDNIIFEIDLTELWFNGGVAYLDFSIISPILPFIRLVLGCILLYSLIVTIVTNINSYIGGNGAKNDSEG
ncbi:hypothetical protein [Methanobrevibacter sp.]|uniref:hypothetical protein n=1 Tax=Methanobrevibacter sp. TaxID=66852 RepID=UPI00388F2979